MESKSPEFLIDLQQSMDDEKAQIDSTIKEWKEAKQLVKKTSDILTRGLLGLENVDQEINSYIGCLSFLKEGIDAIPEGSNTTFVVKKIARTTRSRIYEQEKIESMKKSSLPNAQLMTVMDILLRACGIDGGEKLNKEQKDQLKRLQAAVNNEKDVIPRNNGDDFLITMTFWCQSGEKIGTVLIKPDNNIYPKLRLTAFLQQPSCETTVVDVYIYIFETKSIDNFLSIYFQAGAGSYVLLSDIAPIIEKMFQNREFLISVQKSSDADCFFKNSVVGCRLGFLLNNHSKFLMPSVPFGRIVEGRKVIETLSTFSQDAASKNIKVEIGQRYGRLDDQQEGKSN